MNTIVIDGRVAIAMINPRTGRLDVLFPTLFLDNTNPTTPFTLTVDPTLTYAALIATIQAIFDANPAS